MENLRLLLTFLKGEPRVPDAFRWGYSIDIKLSAVFLFYEEVLGLIPECLNEINESEKEGYGSVEECNKLTIKYEAFLNSIYGLCENLSRIVRYLYRAKNLPPSFLDQKARFLKDKTIDPDFSNLLSATDWYDEVCAIRSEATHFLSGLITISSSSALGYANLPKSERKEALKEISIQDLEKHIKKVFEEVMTFLEIFGNHFLKVIKQDSSCSIICYIIPPGKLGAKTISLKELLNSESGTCLTTEVSCPEKNSCEAYKKAKKRLSICPKMRDN